MSASGDAQSLKLIYRCTVNRKTLLKLIEQAEIKYYSGQINDKAGDQKQLCNVVNDLLQKSKKPLLPQSDSDEALAEQFSEFFSTKIMEIHEQFPSKVTEPFSYETVSNTNVYLTHFEPTSELEVRNIICKSPCKSCELEPLPASLVKKCVDDLVPYITTIVNKSFAEGTFPSTFNKDCKHKTIVEENWTGQGGPKKL